MKSLLFCLTLALLSASATQVRAIENGIQKSPQSPSLHPGDYVWQPEAAPTGPVVIVVDLAKQMLVVYRNGVRIGRSTISSGRDHHRTPPGIFTILQKKITHHSNIYHEASMPYMERLTWGGLAIHAGNLPGYPESHGCVHVPMAFAKKLFGITDKGTTVLITDASSSENRPAKPDLVFARANATAPLPSSPPGTPAFSWNPAGSPSGSPCIVFSSAEKEIYVYRGGVEIGRARVGGDEAGRSVGDRVYAALPQTDAQGLHRWKLLGSLDASPAPDAGNLLGQLVIPPEFLADLRQIVTTGATLVITDEPVRQRPSNGTGNHDILDTASR